MHPEEDDQEDQAAGDAAGVGVSLDPIMEFAAPVLKRSYGHVKEKIDLKEVERLASIGMKPAVIGPCIGFTVAAFRYRFEKYEAVRDAWAKGNAAWTLKMLELTNSILAKPESARNPALLIFALKQAHGAGWADEPDKTPEASANRAELAWDKRKKELRSLKPEVKEINAKSKEINAKSGVGARVGEGAVVQDDRAVSKPT